MSGWAENPYSSTVGIRRVPFATDHWKPLGKNYLLDSSNPTMNLEALARPTMQVNLWASLGYGVILLVAPDMFCDLLKAEAVNTAWLRTIGAALLGTNVLGSWLWLKSPSLDMGRVQTITAGLEAFSMALSLLLGEFTAENIWMVQASVALAFVVTIGLYSSSLSTYYDSEG